MGLLCLIVMPVKRYTEDGNEVFLPPWSFVSVDVDYALETLWPVNVDGPILTPEKMKEQQHYLDIVEKYYKDIDAGNIDDVVALFASGAAYFRCDRVLKDVKEIEEMIF